MGLRDEKKERMRALLFDTATELFRSDGFDATRVRDIVAAAGVSEPTFFNYFHTKEAVLDEFAARTLDTVAERLRTELRAESSIDARLGSLMQLLADVFTTDPEFMALVVTRSGLVWGARGPILERQLGFYDLLTQMFDEAKLQGEIRPELDSRHLAETLTGAAMLAIVNWLTQWWDEPGDLAARLRQQADVVLHGSRARTTPS